MMGLAMMVWTYCSDIVLCIRSTFTQRNNVVRLKKDAPIHHRESWLLAVFARALSALESSMANRGIANVRHPRNHATFHLNFCFRNCYELVDKLPGEGTAPQSAITSLPVILRYRPRNRIQ